MYNKIGTERKQQQQQQKTQKKHRKTQTYSNQIYRNKRRR